MRALSARVDEFVLDCWQCAAPAAQRECSALLAVGGYSRRISPGNVEFSISLLDRRPLAGAPELLAGIEAACRQTPPELLTELAQVTDRRHERFQHTIQHLEPDIKEACGGLRDLNCIRWFCQLRGEAADPLDAAAEALFAIRWALDEHAGRDQNTLRLAEQDALSPEPEAWMRD